MAAMKFSIGGTGGLDWPGHLEVARACEELGFYGFYPSDHLMPIVDRGGSSDRLDALMALSALSGHTSRIRLGCMVQGNLFRQPILTAMMIMTLDHASNGRAELGIGSGGGRREYDAHGIDYPDSALERIARLDESLALITSFWANERTTFEGQYYKADDAPFAPRTVQQPHPPIMVGGMHIETMRVAAKYADEWNALGSREIVRDRMQRMEGLCADAGRDFSKMGVSKQGAFLMTDDASEARQFIERQASHATASPRFKVSPHYADAEAQVRDACFAGSPAELVENIGKWREAGVDHLNFQTPRPFNRGVLERFAAEVMPHFAS